MKIEEMLNKIFLETKNGFEYVKEIPDKSIDMILCDLPYGTTAVACKNLNRNFIGMEIYQEYIDISYKRLKEIKEETKKSTTKIKKLFKPKIDNNQMNLF